ncbi:hypothetical protein WN944_029349 [Citrus x changshan-huyou]|uniref:Uncharacterized protein n=1 Tax=Citrus x changshan-huyou TaxID=2935761 RepID=A0AAP0LM54_9ROSI
MKESFICLKDLVRKRGNEMSSGGGPSVQRSEYRQRTPSIATGIGAKKSHVYMELEVVVAGEKINVVTVIPEQCTLNKLWQDVRDICFDKPIRHANEVKVDVMLPWETTNMHMKTDSDLQDAFKKLKKMTGVVEFALPDLNAEVTVGAGCSNSAVVVLEGDKENGNTAGESINAGSNVNVLDRENNMDDLEYDVSEYKFKFNYEDEWDAGLDSYESGDDSGPSSDYEDENVQAAAWRYEANSDCSR